MTTMHWLDMPTGERGRCCWDQGIVASWTDDLGWEHAYGPLPEPDATGGAVVAVAARYWAERPEALDQALSHLSWCVVILTSDEESLFPWQALTHPAMRLWVQTPHPERHADPSLRLFPHGPAPRLVEALDVMDLPAKDLAWGFAGQVTHRQREEMLAAMRGMAEGKHLATPGFTQGYEAREYAELLARAKVAPSPCGPATADSFRTWEALEAGCVPIVDDGPLADGIRGGRAKVGYPSGFWPTLLDETPPFPVVKKWVHGPIAAQRVLDAWPHLNNRAQAWYQLYRRNLRERLAADVRDLSGTDDRATAAELTTVLVPTSPIPSHPGTEVIEATVASIHAQLPGAEVVLMIDGLRCEQVHYADRYGEYTRRLLWLARQWGATPLRSEDHRHQSGMTRWALAEVVRTPLVLFVEHDTPLDGPIDWQGCADLLTSEDFDVLRFHHEASVLDVHRHTMVTSEPVLTGEGIKVWPTSQWSQRPHLARTEYYRRVMHEHFDPGDRWMVEDRLHSVVSSAWLDHGLAGWQQHRVAIYHEQGPVGIRRSLHLDGRQGEPKWVDK